MNKITVYLEFIVDQPGYEPQVYQKTFPIAHYNMFSQEEAQHTFLLKVAHYHAHGTESKMFDYSLSLQPNILGFSLDEAQIVKVAIFKIIADESTTTGYLCQFNPSATPITVDLLDISWKFLLRSSDDGSYCLFIQNNKETDSSFKLKSPVDCTHLREQIAMLVSNGVSTAEITTNQLWTSWDEGGCGTVLGITNEQLLNPE